MYKYHSPEVKSYMTDKILPEKQDLVTHSERKLQARHCDKEWTVFPIECGIGGRGAVDIGY